MTDRDLILLGAAHVHLPDHLRVAGDEGWRIAAVHDRDRDRRAAWCDKLGAAALDDPSDISPEIGQAVLVCSETTHHEADITAALGAGLPVYTEKPLAGCAAAADRLAALAARSGVMLDTGYFLRTNPAIDALRSRLRDGAIGTVIAARARFSHDGAYADWLDLDGWMTRPDLARYGGFADEAVHVIDWLLWALGPVRDGHAVLGHACGFPVDDHGAAVLTMENGATAVVEAGWTDTRMRLELDLTGTEGGAELRDGQARLWRRGADDADWSATLSPLDAGEGIRPFLRAVAEGRDDPPVPPGDAAAVNRVIDMLYRRPVPDGG